MDERMQYQQMRAAVTAAGLEAEDVWVRYYGLGGSLAAFEVEAYLAGVAVLPALERDLLAGAFNELLEAASLSLRVPRSETSRSTSGRQALKELGAAGAGFLTDAEAEEERLEALRQTLLLDSPPEERFDRITQWARERFNVSSSTIALIADHRQFLKSVVGPVGQNLPREISFCNATIRSAGPLVVEDAREDERFAANPLVTGAPFIRFYAGYPLRGARGWAIGTLCVIDQHPRSFSAEDEDALRQLAALAQAEIDR